MVFKGFSLLLEANCTSQKTSFFSQSAPLFIRTFRFLPLAARPLKEKWVPGARFHFLLKFQSAPFNVEDQEAHFGAGVCVVCVSQSERSLCNDAQKRGNRGPETQEAQSQPAILLVRKVVEKQLQRKTRKRKRQMQDLLQDGKS